MRVRTSVSSALGSLLAAGLLAACGGGGEPEDTLAPVTLASPVGGTYQGAQSVTLTCSDGQGSGCAGTHYTLDGSTPTIGSAEYTSPIPIAEDTELRFFSVDTAGNVESPRSESYVISTVLPDTTPPVTTASPAGGSYTAAQSVTLLCDDGAGSGCAATYYTLDGTIPTTASTPYAAPLQITVTTQLRFFSVDNQGNQESVKSEAYAIDTSGDEDAPVTTAVPPGGTYAAAQSVTLLCDDGAGSGCAATYYTLDGTEPTPDSIEYAAPIQIAADTTLRFFSVDREGNVEAPRSEVYDLEIPDGDPPVTSALPPGGTYTEPQDVVLACDDGAGSGCQATYFTVDGTEPTTASTLYAAPIQIAVDTTLRFFSVDLEGNQEEARTEAYVFADIAPPLTTATPPGGTYTEPQDVVLACDDGAGSGCAATHYTVDGTLPTTASPLVTGAIPITADTTLRFFSVDLEGNQEAPRAEVYVLRAVTAMQASWIGAYGATGPWRNGDDATPGSGDGMMNSPADVLEADGYLYVVDSQNYRVLKFEAATGVFVGWIGGIGLLPTGGASGCEGAVVGEITPGWCTGGAGAYGSQAGAFQGPQRLAQDAGILYVSDAGGRVQLYDLDSGAYLRALEGLDGPQALAADGTYLYVAEYQGMRVSRWSLADGSFQGWIGRTETVPDACEAGLPAEVPGATGSWCFGGAAASGALDGELDGPQGLAVDQGKLYTLDGSCRLQRFDAASGAFEGWVGKVLAETPALGGDCAGQASGYVAQGWCTGGTQQSDRDNQGGLFQPQAVVAHGGLVYVSDYGSRINRYDAASGGYLGWTGVIGTVPPDACLAGIPDPFLHVPTGSWCTGGEAASVGLPFDGALATPMGLAISGSSLFVAEYGNHRVQELDLALGSAIHWLAAYSIALEGWSSADEPGPAAGNADGMFEGPDQVVSDAASDRLYVSDAYRIQKFVASTGEALGWIGRTATMPDSCEGSLPAVVPGPTGGWCRGGSPQAGMGDGELASAPAGLLLDGGYLIASDGGNGRIVRFTLDGAFAGWIGRISSTNGIGPAECAAAGPGAFSPTWCTGGTSATYSLPLGVPGDLAKAGGELYVVAGNHNHINRIHLLAGEVVAYGGWTGRVGPNPGDRPTSCDLGAIPEAGQATLDWCYGGASQQGLSDGAFYGPSALAVADDSLLVGDYHRVSAIASSGAYLGPAVTGLNRQVQGLFFDPVRGELLVAHGFQILKYDLDTAQLLGWAGGIGVPPTGGDPGCSAAAAGSFTPGWCTGGEAAHGSFNGFLFSPWGVFADESYVYVPDVSLHRVTRFDRQQQ